MQATPEDCQAVLRALLSLHRTTDHPEGFTYERIRMVACLPPRSARTFYAVNALVDQALVRLDGPVDLHAHARFRLTDAGLWRATSERYFARRGSRLPRPSGDP